MSETGQKLSEVCRILVSNVDKKSTASELPVRLCNYMDVYSNSYIHDRFQFMEATANSGEIEKFKLEVNDVIITKDSETPDDIASAAVVTEPLTNVVCGYHLAILKPSPELIDGKYLMFFLGLPQSRKYFESQANGSTRYGLTIGAIEGFSFRLPPLPIQRKIARILSTVDRQIEHTEALIGKYEMAKQGLMQDLFTRGIDPATGKLRPRYEDAPELYWESELGWVPRGWEVMPVRKHLSKIEQGWSPNCDSEPAGFGEWGVLKTTAVTWKGYDPGENKKLPKLLKPRIEYEVYFKDVLITRAGPNSRVGVVAFVDVHRPKLILSDKLYRLKPANSVSPEFLALALSSHITQNNLSGYKTGLAESQTNISQKIVGDLLIVIPSSKEQELIVENMKALNENMQAEKKYLGILEFQKTGLMQDLLTGKVPVNP